MDQKLSKSIKLKNLPWLRIFITVLGGFVIFGLGFALGLYYAQNLYLMEDKFINSDQFFKQYNSDVSKTRDEFKFFYELKKPIQELKKEQKKETLSKERKKTSELPEPIEDETSDQKPKETDQGISGYTIQVYSFKSKDISEKVVAQLKKNGFPAYKSRIDLGNDNIYYRVRIGHFDNRNEAARILEKIIESENKEAFITRD